MSTKQKIGTILSEDNSLGILHFELHLVSGTSTKSLALSLALRLMAIIIAHIAQIEQPLYLYLNSYFKYMPYTTFRDSDGNNHSTHCIGSK